MIFATTNKRTLTPDNATAWDIMYLSERGISIEKSMGQRYYFEMPNGEWVEELNVPIEEEFTNWKQDGF